MNKLKFITCTKAAITYAPTKIQLKLTFFDVKITIIRKKKLYGIAVINSRNATFESKSENDRMINDRCKSYLLLLSVRSSCQTFAFAIQYAPLRSGNNLLLLLLKRRDRL